MTHANGCLYTERNKRKRTDLITTNPVYRCEELEDRASVYDSLDEDQVGAVCNEMHPCDVYLDIIGDDTNESDQGDMPPQLPKPRPEPQNQDRDYEGLKNKRSDHMYLPLFNNDTHRCEQLEVEEQIQDAEVQEKDAEISHRDYAQDSKPQDQNLSNNNSPVKSNTTLD